MNPLCASPAVRFPRPELCAGLGMGLGGRALAVFAQETGFRSTRGHENGANSPVGLIKTDVFATRTDDFVAVSNVFVMKTDVFGPDSGVCVTKTDEFASDSNVFVTKTDVFALDPNVPVSNTDVGEAHSCHSTTLPNEFVTTTPVFLAKTDVWKEDTDGFALRRHAFAMLSPAFTPLLSRPKPKTQNPKRESWHHNRSRGMARMAKANRLLGTLPA